jgi:hypothetical protein
MIRGILVAARPQVPVKPTALQRTDTREVRRALVYVLQNRKKHAPVRSFALSSAAQFDGFALFLKRRAPARPTEPTMRLK